MNSYKLLLKAGDYKILLVPRFFSSVSRVGLQRDIADVCRDRPPFFLRVRGEGTYGNHQKRVVYLDVGPELRALHGNVVKEVKDLGCEFERGQGLCEHYHPMIVPKSWRERPKIGESLKVEGIEFVRCAEDVLPEESLVLWPCV